MATISTHVLDTSRGVPGTGIRVQLHRLHDEQRHLIASAVTNADGRTDAPLLAGDRLETGIYELTFFTGEYFSRGEVPMTNPPFLGEVVIRVGIADANGNYHVPLLLSPYGYSTYRGS